MPRLRRRRTSTRISSRTVLSSRAAIMRAAWSISRRGGTAPSGASRASIAARYIVSSSTCATWPRLTKSSIASPRACGNARDMARLTNPPTGSSVRSSASRDSSATAPRIVNSATHTDVRSGEIGVPALGQHASLSHSSDHHRPSLTHSISAIFDMHARQLRGQRIGQRPHGRMRQPSARRIEDDQRAGRPVALEIPGVLTRGRLGESADGRSARAIKPRRLRLPRNESATIELAGSNPSRYGIASMMSSGVLSLSGGSATSVVMPTSEADRIAAKRSATKSVDDDGYDARYGRRRG